MFTVTTETPEAMRAEFVSWLKMMQEREINDKKSAYGKRHELNCEVRALTYQRAAEFWERVVINPKS